MIIRFIIRILIFLLLFIFVIELFKAGNQKLIEANNNQTHENLTKFTTYDVKELKKDGNWYIEAYSQNDSEKIILTRRDVNLFENSEMFNKPVIIRADAGLFSYNYTLIIPKN